MNTETAPAGDSRPIHQSTRRGCVPLRVIVLFALLLSLTATAAPAMAAGWFIPQDQSIPSACRKSALAAHPGRIERIRARMSGGTLKVRIYIEQDDGREWIVFCDATSGVIDKSILVDDL